jgi:charged multivesicular body protein 4
MPQKIEEVSPFYLSYFLFSDHISLPSACHVFLLTRSSLAALLALKRKKLYEQQIEKIEGTRMTIETQVLAIEETSVNVEAMAAIRSGAQTMQQLHQSMFVDFSYFSLLPSLSSFPPSLLPSFLTHLSHRTIDDVDNTMEEIQEQMDIASEISTAISQPIGGSIYDDVRIIILFILICPLAS